ncbi:MAG: dCTP deaminase [Candidatus Omnitrophica bacterium]|nr:dCTP deaminase [Candidatus Omnitrophota bacterium]
MGEKMITPFSPEKVKKGISFGVSSYGYDFVLSDEFLIFKGKGPISPKKIDDSDFEKFKGNICIVPPNSFVLGKSLEYFRIPRDVIGLCFGKSTYARCGIVVNVTPLEPEWEGHLTVQIANLTPMEAEIYAGEGIGQIIFLSAVSECEKSYKDVAGKYQASKGIVLPK